MNLTIERDALNAALSRIAGLVPARETVPILQHIKLEAEGETLTVSANNMDQEARESVPAQVEAEGAVCVPWAHFRDIVRRMDKGAVIALEQGERDVALRSGRARFALSSLPADDFPVMDAGEMVPAFAATAGELKSWLKRVEFAISTEETRFYLCGVHIQAGEHDLIRAVATDGNRLALADRRFGPQAPFEPAILPGKGLRAMLAWLGDDDGAEVSVEAGASRWRFWRGGAVFTTALIDATYPPYQNVIPKPEGEPAVIEREALSYAVDLVATIGAGSKCLALRFVEGAVELSMREADAGEGVTDVACDYAGEKRLVGVNYRYLRDCLTHATADRLQIWPGDGGGPMLIKPEGGEDGGSAPG